MNGCDPLNTWKSDFSTRQSQTLLILLLNCFGIDLKGSGLHLPMCFHTQNYPFGTCKAAQGLTFAVKCFTTNLINADDLWNFSFPPNVHLRLHLFFFGDGTYGTNCRWEKIKGYVKLLEIPTFGIAIIGRSVRCFGLVYATSIQKRMFVKNLSSFSITTKAYY